MLHSINVLLVCESSSAIKLTPEEVTDMLSMSCIPMSRIRFYVIHNMSHTKYHFVDIKKCICLFQVRKKISKFFDDMDFLSC